MAWENSDRKARLPANWAALRQIVLTRCGGRCEEHMRSGKRCRDRATDVDHIVPGDDHSVGNLRGICAWHHKRKSGQEGAAASAARQAAITAKLTRKPEKHPGTLTGSPSPLTNKGF